jgi:hypothetical protein
MTIISLTCWANKRFPSLEGLLAGCYVLLFLVPVYFVVRKNGTDHTSCGHLAPLAYKRAFSWIDLFPHDCQAESGLVMESHWLTYENG